MKKWAVRSAVAGAVAVMLMAPGLGAGWCFGQDGPPGPPPSGSEGEGGERRTPPPEAYKACEGKSEGAAAQLSLGEGRTLAGICRLMDGKLVLIPDFMREGPGRPQ